MDSSYSSSVSDEVDGAKGDPWQYAYREALSPYIFKRVLILSVLYLGAFSVISPLGADHMTWIQRMSFLSLCGALCAPLFYSEYVLTLYLTRSWNAPSIAMAALGASFVATPTATTVVYGIDTLLPPAVLAPDDWPTVYLFLTISVLICGTVNHYLVSQRLREEAGGEEQTVTLPEPAPPDAPAGRVQAAAVPDSAALRSNFLRRLPAEAGHDIIYLKMHDHYVEVVTVTGQCTLLMRFADAIHELANEGIRVHRSYWVALRHVEGWVKRNQRMFLRLADGHTVPVSRSYLARTRAAVDGQRPPRTTSGKEPT